MKIIVPATSANVGPGFDSVGIAVTRYLTIEVLEPADAWLIEHDLGAGIPTDEKNLLLQTSSCCLPSGPASAAGALRCWAAGPSGSAAAFCWSALR